MNEELREVEILLAEDNPADAEMTLRALRKNNLANNVHWVKDGVEAIDFLFCQGAYADRDPSIRPKLVMLDIKMPKMDGIEVLKLLRANEQTRMIPVVILTSSNEERDVVQSYSLGVNSFIVKPVDFSQFMETVRSVGLYWMLCNRPPYH